MVQRPQTALHAQVNQHHLNSATSMINGRANGSIIGSSCPGHQAIGPPKNSFSGGNHNHNMGIYPHHHTRATNYATGASYSNHHQSHNHLGHNAHRNRHLSSSATTSATSLDSHFTHSHFNSSNLSQNSHPLLSLPTNSSMSSASSSPLASISPASLTIGPPPQSNLCAPSYHHAGNKTSNVHNSNLHHHHYNDGSNHVIDSHHSSSQQQQQQQQQPNGSQQNTSRYKTELCRPFEENGTCKYGEKCQFAHGLGELRTLTRHPKYKTEFCRTFHTTGFCPYGPRCHFIHNSKTPSNQSSISLGPYGNIPFGHQTSHSASPSTSPISSTSSATTTNGSLSSSDSTTSSISPPSSSRLIDVSIANYSYDTVRHLANNVQNGFRDSSAVEDLQAVQVTDAAGASRRNENEEVSHSAGCASETQRLFWLHSHMNEGSRWPPALCASGLIGSNDARRTWQMQA